MKKVDTNTMKLVKARVTKFQSIQDSNEFNIGDVTCLVGKNEAGKTALLKALYRLNPVVPEHERFDVVSDFPRREVTAYRKGVKSGKRGPADVVHATFLLDDNETEEMKGVFGPTCFHETNPTITLSKGYSNEVVVKETSLNVDASIQFLLENANFVTSVSNHLSGVTDLAEIYEILDENNIGEEARQDIALLSNLISGEFTLAQLEETFVLCVPKFLYFDDYFQIKGHDNLDRLLERYESNTLDDADYPLIGLVDLAGLDLRELVELEQTVELIAQINAAESQLSNQVLAYWSQNRHLGMKFDIRKALTGDPEGMRTGTNIWASIIDRRHHVETLLGSRSRGFIWFFSFLAWYNYLLTKHDNLILLLDEPGLSLHAKAQEDLLRYFEEELIATRQLIYTTHSPFMVDPSHFERVRIVQDLTIDLDEKDLRANQIGTRVSTDILEAKRDSLFPLQGALGYEIYQTLFVGPNSLVVEGASDLHYIQTMSALLQRRGMEGLSPDWTITPVGGADNVPTFVALIGAQTKLNVAVLIDLQRKGRQKVQNLYKRRLLKKKQVLTFADFISGDDAVDEADIEDMFPSEFYLKLVKGELGPSVSLDDFAKEGPRIVRRLDNYLKEKQLPPLNHFRPALYLSKNIDSLSEDLSDQDLCSFENAFKALNALL